MLMKQQRTFQQQQKCLHVITCLLFSCLLLLIEWQAAFATPILTKSITSTTITSSKTVARHGVGGVSGVATRRLREHAKPSKENTRRGHKRSGGGGGGGGASSSQCEHKSLGELIKTSPVILKALGAHIFNHDDDEDLRILHNSNDALLLKWQNEQNKVLTSLKRTEQQQQKFPYSTLSSSSSSSSLSLSATKSAEKTRQLQNKQTLSSSLRSQSRQQQQTFSDAATNRAAMLASMNADAILITLTPETIYKGASLLKMTPNAAEHATSRTMSSSSSGGGGGGGFSGSSSTNTNSFGNSNNANSDGSGGSSGAGLNAGTINSSEASYLYEGQLNATVQPLSCFDDNLLKLLPSDLIIFGKLITIDEQQQQQQLQQMQQQRQQTNDFLIDLNDYTLSSATASQQHHQQQPATKEVLKISINGLHRWSSQFENYIWKHLGWDDWSDFTVCSVACGKGVQQRFRRCLLDNPMVNLNMNFNNDDDDDDDVEEDDIDVDMDVDADVVVEMELEEDLVEDVGDDSSDSIMVDDVDVGGENEQHKTIDDGKHNVPQNFATSTATTTTTTNLADNVNHQNYSEKSNILITGGNMLHFVTTPRTKINVETTMKTEEEPEVMRIYEGHFNDTFPLTLEATARDTLTINNGKSFKEQLSSVVASASALPLKDKVNATKSKKQKLQQQQQQKRKTKHRKHKSAKFYSTMFCEGYNIEQRNCNSFECSDDINDLLKFYRKYSTTDETNTVSTQTMMMDYSNTMAAAAAATASSSVPTIAGPSLSSSTTNSEIDGTAQNNENLNTFTTPINMGYVLNWHNILNFTIMLTLRVKNDSYTTATIFSIRNSTHNLYLESCKDGLRLYLERDKTTEMLPIKFNLYDYHWHQVAISIQNGDFISIHVDCSWTNSFVVSKRLFSLPLAADVEIGRGFNGELQQLLILPEHQERYQCSEKRTSINEVKRYIIDTFIDDYAN